MKKIFTIAAVAIAMASCGTKEAGICVDKFYENPVVGSEIVIAGQAKVCCCSGALLLTGSEKNVITVAPAEGVVVPENVKGAIVEVKGVVSTTTIDEQYVADLAAQAEAAQDSTEKAKLTAKVEKVKAAIEANGGPITKYTIAATEIVVKDACCKKEGKEGCKKEGKACCKKDSAAKCEGAKEEKKCDEAKGETKVEPAEEKTAE
ncbi:MAG: hypothetical protein LBS12_07105 [Prevotellaceae bacterium]|jgi:hypothetical protein|nr:hypothetical protein [Prevotellaceae bacterium]